MAMTHAQRDAARRLIEEVPDIDRHLPIWARRDNPIVRRDLGDYWRVFPPEIWPILTWLLVQGVILAVSVQFTVIFIVVMIALLIAAVAMPFMIYNYAVAMIQLINGAARSMAQEYEHDTIHLLRATPYTTTEIILSKITAAVWRRMDTIAILTVFTLTLGMPASAVFYLNLYPPEQYPILPQVMTFIALVAHLIRVPLEMAMAAGVGVLLGAAARSRQAAFFATVGVMAFYFILLNMLRFLSVDWPVRLFFDAGLPVLLPALILYLSVRRTRRILIGA